MTQDVYTATCIPTRNENTCHKKTCRVMFFVALFIIDKDWTHMDVP
jgi:hypothetical protein